MYGIYEYTGFLYALVFMLGFSCIFHLIHLCTLKCPREAHNEDEQHACGSIGTTVIFFHICPTFLMIISSFALLGLLTSGEIGVSVEAIE